jgi:hypothetical protein
MKKDKTKTAQYVFLMQFLQNYHLYGLLIDLNMIYLEK